ncbi:MAG: hypothetical protein ACERKS_13315 [Candidatus Bathyarchaeota archaeon]
MKYGYIAFGKLKQDIMGGGPESINKAMAELIKIAEKHEMTVKTYGYPFGVIRELRGRLRVREGFR